MINSQHMFNAYSLGATLYMPVIHPKVPEILAGQVRSPASSIVLCLEDALAENDVERGIAALKTAMAQANVPDDLRVFVRPRSLEMAHRLSGFNDITRVEGFVAPKIRAENAASWMEIAAARGLQIMPTLETSEFFDPGRVAAVRDILSMFDHKTVSAIRLGGNDLLGSLGLRRQRGVTSWEGPLGWVLSMCSSMFISAGFPVAAPVFDIIDDLDTLKREVERDIASGFISKTAIHPAQVAIIEDAMCPAPEEVQQARAILDKDAKAVFQIGGVMCEPSTHHNWAMRVCAREARHGVSTDNSICEWEATL